MARLKQHVETIVDWMKHLPDDYLLRIKADPSFGEQCARELEDIIRHATPGEKVYVPAPDTSKKAQIEAAIRTLPSGVVAERLGVHPSWARKVARGIKRRS